VAWHISFFLKSLKSLEHFRKKPRIQTPSKYPCTNFQSLTKFSNSNKNSKRIIFDSGPPGQLGPEAQSNPRSLLARRPSRPSPSSGQEGLSHQPDRAPPHAVVPASPPPSFLLRGRHADYPTSTTELPPLPTTPPPLFFQCRNGRH
jgi:hypothetical protein